MTNRNTIGSAFSWSWRILINKKFFINTKKLSLGILDIRYLKNRHQIPIKQQHISSQMKEILQTLLTGVVDKKEYEKLTMIDKHLYRSLLPYFGKLREEIDDEQGFYDRFEVICGQLKSGNDNLNLKLEIFFF
jgi:hypothetical protein